MKIYYEVLPNTLGKVMYRIRKELIENAPPWVEFVGDSTKSDLQILDVVGTGSFGFLYKTDYVLLQHCFKTAETQDESYWKDKWSRAKLVASYLELPDLDFNYLRIPWGVNPDTFYLEPQEKIYKVFTTGYVSEYECLGEIFDAVKSVNSKMVHVGGSIFKDIYFCDSFENITDKKMRALYNRSNFVAGMRKGEGFELPILEGMLCGARGITLDYPNYRYWYGDLVEYIEDGPYEFVKQQLVELFSKPARLVTENELEYLKSKFSWSVIAKTFWTKLGETLNVGL